MYQIQGRSLGLLPKRFNRRPALSVAIAVSFMALLLVASIGATTARAQPGVTIVGFGWPPHVTHTTYTIPATCTNGACVQRPTDSMPHVRLLADLIDYHAPAAVELRRSDNGALIT